MTKEEYFWLKRQLIRVSKYEQLSKIIKDLEGYLFELQSYGGDDIKFVPKEIVTVIDIIPKNKKNRVSKLLNLIAEYKARRDQI